jgi:hypothetical protein
MTSLSHVTVAPALNQSLNRLSGNPVRFVLMAVIVFMATGCASSAPGIEDKGIKRKFDLRLQMALGGHLTGEPLGEYVRVIIRMRSSVNDEDRQELDSFGTIGSVIGPVVTLTIRPERLVQVAALSRVTFIEFDAGNVPMPIPPHEPQ